ncbi:mRNA-capping enzyme subunit beta [Cryptococcus bacillisporus CA1280]|uniref:mRNA-capping enzyme subunit beta n=1 Tax=Cryptococcus bacillisporus CA1280 TaxID=1296109 RepID=A0A0D0VGV1_CRYGA|nr:mRNA-capping enzyme subunit beta [Cryptococcus bacillisporus CA1280]
MPTYIPIHDRPPHYANLPSPPSTSGQPRSLRYSSPDIDPDTPLPRMSSAHESDPVEQVNASQPGNSVSRQGTGRQGAGQEEGHSRKRARTSPSHSGGNGSYVPRERTEESHHSHHNGHSDAPSGQHDSGQIYRPRHGPVPLTGSIFNLSPRNPFTSVVGDFIMNAAMGHSNVEIELKLGTFMTPSMPGQQPRRINMPTLSEMIIPHDYPNGPFVSTINHLHHRTLNELLNRAVESQSTLPTGRLYFSRSKLADSFYDYSEHGHGKVRVSRDMDSGQVVQAVEKRRIADMNVYCPGMAYDFRISVNTETPCEVPTGGAKSVRYKDRACYRHQVCRVDLTSVFSSNPRNAAVPPSRSFELEIEVLDVPALLAEGDAQSERFDEILQNLLDSARMLVKNI